MPFGRRPDDDAFIALHEIERQNAGHAPTQNVRGTVTMIFVSNYLMLAAARLASGMYPH